MIEQNITPRQKRSMALRKRIYEEAIRLFNASEYDEVTINDICAAAEITSGSFYHFFESKDHILQQYSMEIDTYFDSIVDTFDGMTASETFEQLIRMKINQAMIHNSEIGRSIMLVAIKTQTIASLDPERKFYLLLTETLKKGIANGEFRSNIVPENITNLCKYAILGLITHWTISKDRESFQCLIDDIFHELNALIRPGFGPSPCGTT